MKRRPRYFKIGDIVIYVFFIVFFTTVGLKAMTLANQKASRVEIYVDGELKYTYPLQKEEKNLFVNTVLGGVNVRFKDDMVRVTSSNSPLKINVKRGWIKNPGEVIIGIPDRLLVKVVGDKELENENIHDVDFIIR